MVKKRKECNKGYGCGSSCISRKRVCKSNIGQDGKKLVENFTQYLQRIEIEDRINKVVEKVVKGEQTVERAAARISQKDLLRRAIREKALEEALKKTRNLKLNPVALEKSLEELVKEKVNQLAKEKIEQKPSIPNKPGRAKRPENVNFREAQPQPMEVVDVGRRVAEQFIDSDANIDPVMFENLRNNLLSTASFGPEEALENVEFSNTIEPERLERIKKSLAESAMLTNQIPRKNFKMINDRRQTRAYADSSFSGGDSWELLNIANDQGLAGNAHATDNISSQYYRENEGMYPIINVGEYQFADTSTTYHEYAHHVEYANRDIASMNKDWVEMRSTGAPRTMNDLTDTRSYGPKEVALPDSFITPYVGLVVPTTGAGNQTEVFSIGFQYFSNSDAMAELYNKDSEHFFLILGTLAILRGEA